LASSSLLCHSIGAGCAGPGPPPWTAVSELAGAGDARRGSLTESEVEAGVHECAVLGEWYALDAEVCPRGGEVYAPEQRSPSLFTGGMAI